MYASDGGNLDAACSCPVCTGEEIRRKDLHELFKSKNFSAGRFATIHNVFFFNNFLEQIREAIKNESLRELKRRALGKLKGDAL
jgi:queuine tRNA-ribosyltransferase